MKIHRLEFKQLLPIDLSEAWDFFSSPGNLNDITPAEMSFEILSGADRKMYAGQLIRYKIRPLLNIPMSWVTEITQCVPQRYFIDEQRFGPYAFWHHQHHFKAAQNGVEMTDLLHYALPMGWLGDVLMGRFVRKKVEGIFHYRSQVLEERFGKDPSFIPYSSVPQSAD